MIYILPGSWYWGKGKGPPARCLLCVQCAKHSWKTILITDRQHRYVLSSVRQPISPLWTKRCLPLTTLCVENGEGVMKALCSLLATIIHTFDWSIPAKCYNTWWWNLFFEVHWWSWMKRCHYFNFKSAWISHTHCDLPQVSWNFIVVARVVCEFDSCMNGIHQALLSHSPLHQESDYSMTI